MKYLSALAVFAASCAVAQGSTIFDAVAGSSATAGQYGILAGSNTNGYFDLPTE